MHDDIKVGTISEVGYITNKLTEKLKARGAHDVLAPVHPHQKSQGELSSDDIWQHEKENWMRQKEELKAWAKSQGTDASTSNQSPKVGAVRMRELNVIKH